MVLSALPSSSAGFNRNIVECKLSKEPAEPPPPLRFNRNIVECKFYYKFLNLPYTVPVLIETLWNVNDKQAILHLIHKHVLIETLWNVNMKSSIDICPGISVLIETLWNVNFIPNRLPESS